MQTKNSVGAMAMMHTAVSGDFIRYSANGRAPSIIRSMPTVPIAKNVASDTRNMRLMRAVSFLTRLSETMIETATGRPDVQSM